MSETNLYLSVFYIMDRILATALTFLVMCNFNLATVFHIRFEGQLI